MFLVHKASTHFSFQTRRHIKKKKNVEAPALQLDCRQDAEEGRPKQGVTGRNKFRPEQRGRPCRKHGQEWEDGWEVPV